ncbi:MAG: diaminopimelate epimerase [Gammaproteobacteria bacterium]|nr:diaminopimelate epimerase [Gammaproteobacteria bacterium]
MSLKFIKMQGLGNDFVVIDCVKEKVELNTIAIRHIADRHLGVGCDQVLVIEPADAADHDYRYRIFNADGNEVAQCGNGARCVAHYLFTENLIRKNVLLLATVSGKIELMREENGEITANMGKPQFAPDDIPLQMDQAQNEYQLLLEDKVIRFGAVSMGNPHAVIRVGDVLEAPVQSIGQLLQQHAAFPKQVNVGFMEIISPEHIRLRVYERGVGETLACGSGACAAVAVGRHLYDLSPRVRVDLPGGTLKIKWHSPQDDLFMTGPAKTVFKGELI